MLVRVKKTTGTIVFENASEIGAFKQMLEWYMDMVWEKPEEDGDHPDKIAKKLDEKFNPENQV